MSNANNFQLGFAFENQLEFPPGDRAHTLQWSHVNWSLMFIYVMLSKAVSDEELELEELDDYDEGMSNDIGQKFYAVAGVVNPVNIHIKHKGKLNLFVIVHFISFQMKI